MAENGPTDPDALVEERMNADLGVDVAVVEAQLRFRLDHARMQRGDTGRLGYLLIDRDHYPDAALVYATPAEADAALTGSPLVDSLCEEDCLDAYTLAEPGLDDLAGREVILP